MFKVGYLELVFEQDFCQVQRYLTIKFQLQKRLRMLKKYENKISSHFHRYTQSFNPRREIAGDLIYTVIITWQSSLERIWTHCASSALFATNANHTRNHLSFEAALWASSSSVIWRTFSYAVTYHTVYIHTRMISLLMK